MILRELPLYSGIFIMFQGDMSFEPPLGGSQEIQGGFQRLFSGSQEDSEGPGDIFGVLRRTQWSFRRSEEGSGDLRGMSSSSRDLRGMSSSRRVSGSLKGVMGISRAFCLGLRKIWGCFRRIRLGF